MERESPLIASDKSLGDVSFDCGGQSCGFTSMDARVIPAEEYSIAEHHCLDRNILLLAAVVRNTNSEINCYERSRFAARTLILR